MNSIKRYRVLCVVMLTVLLCACSKSDVGSIGEEPIDNNISIATRSTDSFTEGEVLCLENLTEEKSAKYTFSGDLWSSDAPLAWADDADQPIELIGYIEKEGASSSSVVLGDVSTSVYQQDELDSSDFLYYYNAAALRGSSSAIDIDIEHKMAKVVIYVSLEDSPVVKALSISSPTSMTFENGEWSPSTDKLTVVAHKEGNTHTCYVIPNSWETPQVSIALEGGETITATYGSAISLVAGNEYSIAIRTSDDGTTAEFAGSFTVQDWQETTNLGSSSSSLLWDGSIADGYGGGTGTVSDPYLINTPNELAYLAYYVNTTADDNATEADNATLKTTSYQNKYFKLTADIDLNNIPWTPIGNDAYASFGGAFDGGGHTIYNLNIDTSEDSAAYTGLFGSYTAPATLVGVLSDLTLDNPTVVASGTYCAALVGYSLNNLTLSNCSVVGGTISNTSGANNKYVGAIIGQATQYANSIIECKVIGTTVKGSGVHRVGGLAGRVYSQIPVVGCVVSNVTIENIASTSSANYCTGGLIGELPVGTTATTISTIVGCSVSGTMNCGKSYAGGFIGHSVSYPSIIGCYSTMELTGESDYIGGFIGVNKVELSHSDINTLINASYTTWQGGSAIGVVYDSAVASPLDGDNNGSIKVNDIGADEAELMNSAISSAGYDYQYIISSKYEGLPYEIQ